MDIYQKYINEAEKEVENAILRIKTQHSSNDYVPLSSYPNFRLIKIINNYINDLYPNLDEFQIELGLPPSNVETDYSVPLYDLAKRLKTNPQLIGNQIADKLRSARMEELSEIEIVNGYLNIKLTSHLYYNQVLSSVLNLKELYGKCDLGKGKTILIDYSSPNVAKPIGIGHLRSTVIGQSLGNLCFFVGFTVVRVNHLGDWGTQFGALCYAYKHWVDLEKYKENPLEELKDLYVKFNTEAEKNPQLRDEARSLFFSLEKNDFETLRLWKDFRDISITEFKKLYERLDVKFDLYLGESFYNRFIDEIIDLLLENKISKKENENVVIVDSIDGLPSFLLRKSDGSSLYITRDLAALKYRISMFNPSEILYVVGSEQELNFKQLFALAKRAPFINSEIKLKHIGFGLVLKDSKKMSTRQGSAIKLDDVLHEAISKSRDVLFTRDPNLKESEIASRSEKIGIGAVIYNDLSKYRLGNIDFDWQKMINLEGQSSAYLQYTYARIVSLLNKVDNQKAVDKDMTSYIYEQEIEYTLAKKISLFPQVLLKCFHEKTVHYLAYYLEDIASTFNRFYSSAPILKCKDQELLASRVALADSSRYVLKNGLNILNIPILEKI